MKSSLDTQGILNTHRKIIQKKGYLKRLYADFYQMMNVYLKTVPEGIVLELGSGGGFIKEIIPHAVTSDVIPGEGIDMVITAEKLPYRKNELSAILMLNVFHHIKDCKTALKEFERCLKPGGRVIMIEPSNSILSSLVLGHLYRHERFDPLASWKIKGAGRLSDSNQALAWIVFSRDRKIFEKNYKHLAITNYGLHTPFSYLVSGGLSQTQILPTASYPIVRALENALGRLNKLLGMFILIVLEKK